MDKNITKAETIHERIELCVKYIGDGKNTVFAQKIGVSEGNIRGYIKGVVPKADVLEKIVRCCDVDPDWLLTGRGEMRKTNSTVGGIPPDGGSSPDNKDKQIIPEKQENTAIISQLLDTIREQAEEIGQLKALIADLERRIRAAEDTHTTAAAG
jgi:transcriptional regulator with XRE-family HTH domain